MKYLETKTTGELGVIEVNKVVRLNNSIFQVIQHENDIGVDALIEFIKDQVPTNKIIGVQIKTGDSYFYENGDSKLPIDGHYDYWRNYPLNVYGITCKISRETGQSELFWVDITRYIKEHKNEIETGQMNIIRYPSNDLSKFDIHNFKKIFMPYVFHETPDISYKEAVELFNSKKPEELAIGLRVLFKRYSDRNDVWDAFIDYFKNGNIRTIPSDLVYVLSHIPWHGDLWEKGAITELARQYAREKIKKFSRDDVIKLLCFVEDGEISRGTIGQCVEAILYIIDGINQYLESIITDSTILLELREIAALIYAYYKGQDSINFLKRIDDSEIIGLIISSIQEYGSINLY